MDTRLLGISVDSPMPALLECLKILRVPLPDHGDFLGDAFVKALEQDKGGPDKFGAFLSSLAKGWRMHGQDRKGATKIEREAVRVIRVNSEDGYASAVGSLPWMVDPERVLIAKEGLSLVDRLPDIRRACLLASMKGAKELPGMTRSSFRKHVQLARSELRDRWNVE